jgi:RNA polymerase sigma-70 factor (ECF subfamily)
MDLLRRRTGESLDDPARGSDWAAAQPDPLTVLLMAERSAVLAAATARLPAVYREALTLRFEEGMKLEEIAEVTRAPLSTVKSRVQRGLECLKQSITKEGLL